jgi:hypothetical protein
MAGACWPRLRRLPVQGPKVNLLAEVRFLHRVTRRSPWTRRIVAHPQRDSRLCHLACKSAEQSCAQGITHPCSATILYPALSACVSTLKSRLQREPLISLERVHPLTARNSLKLALPYPNATISYNDLQAETVSKTIHTKPKEDCVASSKRSEKDRGSLPLSAREKHIDQPQPDHPSKPCSLAAVRCDLLQTSSFARQAREDGTNPVVAQRFRGSDRALQHCFRPLFARAYRELRAMRADMRNFREDPAKEGYVC